MELDMVADMEEDKVAEEVAAKRNDIDININMEIQFGERVGNGGLFTWAQFFFTQTLPGLRIF